MNCCSISFALNNCLSMCPYWLIPLPDHMGHLIGFWLISGYSWTSSFKLLRIFINYGRSTFWIKIAVATPGINGLLNWYQFIFVSAELIKQGSTFGVNNKQRDNICDVVRVIILHKCRHIYNSTPKQNICLLPNVMYMYMSGSSSAAYKSIFPINKYTNAEECLDINWTTSGAHEEWGCVFAYPSRIPVYDAIYYSSHHHSSPFTSYFIFGRKSYPEP